MLAQIAGELRKEVSDESILAVFSRSLGVDMSIQLLCSVLGMRLGVPARTATPSAVSTALKQYASQQGSTVYLLVDSTQGLYLQQRFGWLPQPMPSNLKVVLACLPSDELTLSNPDIHKIKTPGLKAPDREQVARAAVRSCHRPWNQSEADLALQGIKIKRFGGLFSQRVFPVKHPLFLNLLFLEISSLPQVERASAATRLARMGSVNELATQVIVRCANISSRASLLMKLLIASKYGLLREELSILVGVSEQDLWPLLDSLSVPIVQVAGRVMFRHPLVRSCAERCLISDTAGQQSLQRFLWQSLLARDDGTVQSRERIEEEVPQEILEASDPRDESTFFVLLAWPKRARRTLR